ncbi:MAG: hypothetical protein ACI4RD_02910 [Kiritimatiellia bacterium]
MKKANRNRRKTSLVAAMAAMAVSGAFAAGETNRLDVKVGADVRLRYDVTKGLPNASHGEDGHSDYARIRVRPWLSAGTEDWGLYARIADEFRYYHSPDSKSRKQRFPDVVFIDNLYWRQDGLFDLLDLRIGRQDMAFGARRIIADGTGGDGSRSTYFDAVRAIWHVSEKRTLDVFAVYCAHEDWLPTLGKEHENGKRSHDYDMNGYFQNELGGGLYWQDRSCREFGYDIYYVAKDEIREHDSKYRSEGRHLLYHTFGFRLLPQFTETLSGELELAAQAGDDDLLAGQGYAGVTWRPAVAQKPYVTGAVWGLTGDSDGDRGNHAWHAVFNRETGMGESIVPMYTKYDYNNLIYPHLASGCAIGEASSVRGQLGPLFAPVSESRPDGGEYGNYRGFYVQLRCETKLDLLTGCEWLKGARFALQGEYFEKGDYFADNSDGPALFGRCELSWKF